MLTCQQNFKKHILHFHDRFNFSTGLKVEHLKLVNEYFKLIAEENSDINFRQIQFAKAEIEWLGRQFVQTEIKSSRSTGNS